MRFGVIGHPADPNQIVTEPLISGKRIHDIIHVDKHN